MIIEEAIETPIEFEAQVRDTYRNDVDRTTDIGFPLREKNHGRTNEER